MSSDHAEKVKKEARKEKPKKQEKAEEPRLLRTRQLVAACSGKQYLVESLLGAGGFGEVYKVSLYKDPEKKFAMKVEPNFVKKGESMLRLKVEIHVFESIEMSKTMDRKHFVKMHDKGITSHFKYYVMDMIWASLSDITKNTINKAQLSQSTLLQVARQTLASIKELHGIGFLHRDIKKGNFAVGLPPKDSVVYMLDFGIARPYKGADGKVRIARERVQFMGSKLCASVRAIRKEDQGRRDDIESWMYMIVDMYSPTNFNVWWANGNFEAMGTAKDVFMKAPAIPYSAGKLKMPQTFVKMIEIIEKTKFADEPDYQFFDWCLIAAAKAEKVDLTLPLDWVGKWRPEGEKKEEGSKMGSVTKEEDPYRYSNEYGDPHAPLFAILEMEEEQERKKVEEKQRRSEEKKARRKESKKKKKTRDDDETLITMEEMLDQLKKKRRMKTRTQEGTTEADYWDSEEDEEDDSGAEDDDYRRRRKKKSRKRRSRERTRTRDYSDRDEEDGYEDDYKIPRRRRSSGGRKKARKSPSKPMKRSEYKMRTSVEKGVARIPEAKIPDEVDKKAEKDVKKKDEKTHEKGSKEKSVTAPLLDDGAYVVLGEANAMEKAQDTKDKKDKKEAEKKDEKPSSKSAPLEPAKKAHEAAPAKKEPADPKKK